MWLYAFIIMCNLKKVHLLSVESLYQNKKPTLPPVQSPQIPPQKHGTLKEDKTVTLKLIGKDNKIIKGNEETTDNGGFFKIIIWFFKNLFKASLTVYQK